MHILADVAHHLHDLDVGAAVLGTLEGRERRRDRRIGVRPRRGDHARGECRVVAAAVLHMKYQRKVEHARLERRKALVRTKHAQKVLRRREVGIGVVYVKAVVVDEVVVRVIAVDSQHREHAHQPKALAYHVVDADVVKLLVIARKREHAALQTHHHILARRLEDDVLGEIARQFAHLGKQRLELLKLFFVGQFAQDEQIGDLFKPEPVVLDQPVHEVVDAVSAIVKLAVARDMLALGVLLVGHDLGDVGDAGDDALPRLVAQTALDVVLLVQRGVERIVAPADLLILVYDALSVDHGCLLILLRRRRRLRPRST